MINTKLAQEIVEMAEIDQKMREEASRSRPWNGEVDKQNTAQLKQIISEFGWPTISLVGEKASQLAWLLVQHADHDLKFQKRCLQLMKEAIVSKEGNVSLKNIAYLTDRILVTENKEQLFGTQFFTSKDGKLVPRPIAKTTDLNKRRAKMDLEPFGEYQKRLTKRGE